MIRSMAGRLQFCEWPTGLTGSTSHGPEEFRRCNMGGTGTSNQDALGVQQFDGAACQPAVRAEGLGPLRLPARQLRRIQND